MNPFFFGESAHALYGVHHPPRGSKPRSAGVVLCYPFAQEYMRAHRAFRQMALLLSGAGFHVLRFDYSGTGDSHGGSEAMSLEQWQADLAVAVEELIDMGAVESVWLVGLRLGGSLALQASATKSVSGLVLWDPVISGNSQLAEATRVGGSDDLELGGVAVPPKLRDELKAMELLRVPVPRTKPMLLAVSADTPAHQELRERLKRDGGQLTYTCVPSDGRWSEFDNWGSALIPQALIRAVVDYLKEGIR